VKWRKGGKVFSGEEREMDPDGGGRERLSFIMTDTLVD